MSRNNEMVDRNDEVVAVGKKKKPKGVLETIINDVIVQNISDIRTTFINEVLIPNTLDWLLDLGTNFLSNILQTPYDSSGRRSSRSFSRGYKSYSDSYERIHGKRERRSEHVEDVRDYESIYFDTRQDAERILSKLQSDIHKYGTVTIRDLFSYCGLKSSWTDAKYGWTNLDKARAFRERDGKYYLELPEPFPIDDD